MGFEELAALRDELAKQAAANKPVKREKKIAEKSPIKKTGKADALVAIIGLLQKNFPLAFPKKPAAKLPLKIGIHKDILAHADQLGADKNQLRTALKAWCWGHRYWDCLTEDAVRVDLQGMPAGQVTKADAEQASKLKAQRRKQPEAVEALPTGSA
ncbi:ProQ/FinO family protein [Methylomonas sp. EFPC1]|uniref:ProQ/FinO family protein n=1 Tax=unclassified Methylomonas TaxID=2608980 RepID=UPI00051BA7E0|nr:MULTISPECIES: ProQ/FinO family protein [unclassified Methylomonas]PKD38205.1 Fertility inhibition FinO [Methylomonas sp. Kb3]QBC27941.1 Fertility inhibition FinO [Methylomonas sp. LW13]QSB03143.1 ProQ/FinO family protein [Methylomonas sp. EFPC1]